MARILVVDDQWDLVDSTAQLFDALGHDTRVALNGLQAVEQTASFAPHLVFMDLDMPLMNGYEAAARITELLAPPHLIAVTACAHADVAGRARAAGFNSVLFKPVAFNTMLFLVDALTREHG